MKSKRSSDWKQRPVSLLEQKDQIERNILEEVSKVPKMPVAAIENLNEDGAFNIIANTFQEGAVANATAENIQCTFNPIDKVIELFERLLGSEKEKTQLMKDILERLR